MCPIPVSFLSLSARYWLRDASSPCLPGPGWQSTECVPWAQRETSDCPRLTSLRSLFVYFCNPMCNAVNQPPSEPVPICIEIDVDVPLLLSGVEVLLLLVLKRSLSMVMMSYSLDLSLLSHIWLNWVP